MIQRLSHATVFVLNQDEALAFYRDKLGFEVRADLKLEGGYRWLTVGPKAQPDMVLILMTPEGPMFTSKASQQLKALISEGAFGIGVFETADCRATYEELSAKGVQFLAPPTERFYGIEAIVKDNSGNWFSLVQTKR